MLYECLFIVQIVFKAGRKEGAVLFNNALNTFYLQLYCVWHGKGKEETSCHHMGYYF